ncbi:dihydroxyacetone kinase subunit L [Pelagibius litoralis]|uniref:Dihydroxyacetone kinase subunit L n=1 Tax=Pelagibius litoralis TaxID=374515 RepID=A0A967KF45_9PROT|nr:DAK2 domain-containing protein [Pelagibius litoralis]NIA69376.1 dihydroxyacetone kinase subunit L [Pelagibius litoralis]
MSGMNKADLQAVLRRAAWQLERRSAELNDLDARTGDGDMGSTLASISKALCDEIEDLPEELGECFGGVVRVIGATSGSSLSAVAMTGFHRMAAETKGRTTVPWPALGGLLQLAVKSMQERSGADLGDKSVIDGLMSVAEAVSEETDPTIMAALADAAVTRSLDTFRDRPSRIGRARLAPRQGIGQDDPGMVALKRVIEAIRRSDDGPSADSVMRAKAGSTSP